MTYFGSITGLYMVLAHTRSDFVHRTCRSTCAFTRIAQLSKKREALPLAFTRAIPRVSTGVYFAAAPVDGEKRREGYGVSMVRARIEFPSVLLLRCIAISSYGTVVVL